MNSDGYLKNVNISDSNKKLLLESLCHHLNVLELSKIKNTIRSIISTIIPLKTPCINKKEWVECSKSCYSGLSDLINIEISSTAYILRTIFNSLIPYNYNELELEIDGNLTGIWNEDYTKINITKFGNNSPRKLILGLGPSACGKTYWAKTIIETFIKSSSYLPNLYLSIDGGIQRESSFIYKFILEVANEACILGFVNLVSTSYFNKTLFDSNIIKYDIIKFLKYQQPISLYVPETLSDCGTLRPQSCHSKIKKYIDITNDNKWTSILIYQHKDGARCSYPKGFKCVGCSVAGKEREIKEGKKYSSAMYTYSMNESIKFLIKSPGIKYIIHNSGNRANKSTIDDYTDYTKYDPIKVYIRERMMINTIKYSYSLFFHDPNEEIVINTNNTNKKSNKGVKTKKINSLLQINTNKGEFFTNLNIDGEITRVYARTPGNLISRKTRRNI